MCIFLFVVSNPYLHAIASQQRRDAAHIRLAIMIREQHLRLDHPCRVDELLDRHGIRLVAGQEGDGDVFDLNHLRDVLGVAGDVYPQAVEGEDEAVVPPLGMELLMAFGGVVGGNGLKGDVVGQLEPVAVGHHRAIAQHLGAALVGNQLGVVACQHFNSCRVEVVEMLMGDEEVVCLGHGGVVDGFLPQFRHGIDHDFLAVVFDADAGVHQGVKLDRLAALGGEAVDFVGVVFPWVLCHDEHPRLHPGLDAAFEVDDLEAFVQELVGGDDRPHPAAAIHGHRLVGGQGRLRLLGETALFDIDVEGVRQMSLIELLGGSHVEQHDIGVGDPCREAVDVGVFIPLLATGGQAQQGE